MSSIATALRAQAATLIALAEALEAAPAAAEVQTPAVAAPAVPEPQKRGRGRPPKGEATAAPAASPEPVAAPPVAAPAAPEADPFDAAPAAPAAPVASLEDVRTALKALAAASTQDNALAVLKSVGGASNLSSLAPEKYGLVYAAAKAATTAKPSAPVEADPFYAPAPAVVEKEPTVEEVKAAVIAKQKATSTETVQKLLMQHGGKATDANGVVMPSLRALPATSYVAFLKALNALPATK